MKVATLLEIIDSIAPFQYAEPWDNVGLQIGHPDNEAGPALVALEVTPAIIDEAIAEKARTIVTHHPLIFSPLKNLVEVTPVARMATALVRANINLIAAHTNLDAMAQGTNGEIADRLGLLDRHFIKRIAQAETPAGFGIIGKLSDPVSLSQFAATCKAAFNTNVVGTVASHGRPIQTVALCSGAGGEILRHVGDADVLVTGELNHHQCAEARDRGIAVVLVGHHESEVIVCPRLVKLIQTEAEKRLEPIEIRAARAEIPPVTRA